MELLNLLQTHDWLFILLIGLIGLIIGSFINVVIYRLPLMMQHEWRQECIEFLQVDKQQYKDNATPVNLLTPRSHCPHCKTPLTLLQNIPLVSYFALKGRCGHCHHKISLQYPIIELLTAITTAIIAWRYGVTLETGLFIILTYGLIMLSGIDFNTQLLPDPITYSLLWLGLFLSMFDIFSSSFDAIIGAVIGYLSLWSIAWSYKLLTGKFGMAHGDFKLFALFGAWFGWQALPIIMAIASIASLATAMRLFLYFGYKDIRHRHIPFGPYLALAGWIIIVFPQFNTII